MKSVSIRELKNNPATALKRARAGEFVVVTNRDAPEALLVGLEQLRVPDLNRLRMALAASLFRDGVVSSGVAARMAGKSRAEMCDLLARLGIPLTAQADDQSVADDARAIDGWLSKPKRRGQARRASSPTPAR